MKACGRKRVSNRYGESVVYRCYDANGSLLYIGVTGDLNKRMAQHRTKSHWYDLVGLITAEMFNTRRDGEINEQMAIALEQPKFNVVHKAGQWAYRSMEVKLLTRVMKKMVSL